MNFLTIGQRCAEIIESQLPENGASLREGARVLDFGCGCGRTIRWLIGDHPEARFYGCDVDAEAIRWCSQNLAGEFRTNSSLPPLSYESASFDVVYCFSVFTHLNESMQDAWFAELRRILRKNGALIVTVHGTNALSGLAEADRFTLRTRGFLHKTSAKLRGLVPSFYHTTWHSESYVTERLKRFFDEVEYVVIPDGLQDCVVARVPKVEALAGSEPERAH